MRVLSYSPIYSHITALAFPYREHQTFTGRRVFPPIYAREGNSLLHMQVQLWVPPCVRVGWWFSPKEFWVIQLVDIVLHMGLQSSLVIVLVIWDRL